MTSGIYKRTKKGNQNMSEARSREWAKMTKKEKLRRMLPTIKAGQTSGARQKQSKSLKKWWAKMTKEEKRKRMIPLIKARQERWNNTTKEERKQVTKKWREAGTRAFQEHWEQMTKEERSKLIESMLKGSQMPEVRQKRGKAYTRNLMKMTKGERLERMLPAITASQKANPSSIEKMIWKELDKLNISYRTQVPFANGRFIVDIYVPAQRLIIECNGDYYHNYKIFPESKKRDKAFEMYAKNNGYKLIWLWEHDIRKDPEKALKIAFF